MTTTVFVSGATGFIAQHIIKALIPKGYNVIGSVRSVEKGNGLVSQFGDKFSYEIVPDIEIEGAFDESLKKHPEITVFLHTASPFSYNVTNPEKELLLPAVNGTKNALAAIKKYGTNIKRVVITSSYAAIADASREIDNTQTIREDSWNEISWEDAKLNPVNGYRGSKTYAEKAGWDFVKNEKPNWSISFVNPTFVFGPQAFSSALKKDSLNTSSEVINTILKLNPDSPIPPQKGGWVDVRDVAKAHIIAFEKDEAINKRLLLNSGRFTAQSIIDILHKAFPEVAKNIPVGVPGSDKEVISTLATIDNSKTKELLGFELIDLKTSVTDSVNQILDARK